MVVKFGVWKRIFELEAGERLQELFLGQRAHHGRHEMEVGGEARRIVGGVVSGQDALRLRDEALGVGIES